jgi:glucose-6-phosphate isomerase
LQGLLKNQPLCFESLKPSYKYSYSKKIINKYKKFSNIRIIGMGGSALGAEAIHDFLKKKIKKNFKFVNNLNNSGDYFQNKNVNLNLIISKSGNTLETISNSNIIIKKKDKNLNHTFKPRDMDRRVNCDGVFILENPFKQQIQYRYGCIVVTTRTV